MASVTINPTTRRITFSTKNVRTLFLKKGRIGGSITLSSDVDEIAVQQPVPIEVTFAPLSITVTDNALSGTFLTTISVRMSDGSPFTGTLNFIAPYFDGGGLFKFSGNTIVLARNLTSSDRGLKNATVSATQGGVTLTHPLSVQVNIAPLPGSPSISLDQPIIRPGTGEFPLSSTNVTISNGPGKSGDRVVICDTGGNETGRQAVLSTGQINTTVNLWAPGAIGNWLIQFKSNTGAILDSKPLQTATLTTKQLFPILHPGSYDNSKVGIIIDRLGPKLSWQEVVTGSISFWVTWSSNGGRPPPDGTVTMRWTVDGLPVSPYVVGPPFPFTLDTTKLTDGTHAVSINFIDSTDADFYRPSLAYQLRPVPLIIIVANNGLNNGPQLVPSTDRGFSAGGAKSSGIDWVKYPGNTVHLHNPIYSYPTKFIPGSHDPSLREFHNWYLEGVDRTVNQEYESIPRFCKTEHGGVFVGPFAALRSNTIEGSYNSVERNCSTIGGRNDAMSDAYSNFVEAPDGSGMVGVDLSGRVYKIAWNGEITIVVGRYGNRAVLPADFADTSWDEENLEDCYTVHADIEAGFDSDLAGGNDLCYDPRNPQILYVAQTLDHCIYKADLSKNPPLVTRFAGQLETPGFADGDARTVALFDAPYSICMTKDGTMYVADHWNHRIRMVSPDGKTVSTLFGKQDIVPTQVQIENNDRIQETHFDETIGTDGKPISQAPYWCPRATKSLSDSYAIAPQWIRLTSTENIVLGEAWSDAVRHIDLTAKTVRRVGIFGAQPGTRFNPSGQLIGSAGNTWFWGDVDSAGMCGPVDDIIFFSIDHGAVGAAAVIWRCSIDGTYSKQFGGDTGYNPTEGGNISGGGHYPWVIAISRTQGRMLTTGAANFGMFCWHIRQPNDPIVSIVNHIGIDHRAYSRGYSIYVTGSLINFPWGCRPGFGQLRGPTGTSMLGIPDTEPFDTLMSKYPDDKSLGEYIQSGFGGVVPRPEITGDDLADLIYFVRRTSLPGCFPVPIATRSSFATDIVPPTISNLTTTRLTSPSTRIQVTWTTDKPTYGFVAAGSPSSMGTQAPYNRYQLEPWEGSITSSYKTSHNIVIDNLPTTLPTHLVVLSKDIAGNSVSSIDRIVT